MKKFWQFAGLLAMMTVVVILSNEVAFSRSTGVQPSGGDVFCTGGGTNEVCIDSSGNVLPTTTTGGDLGTAAFPWGAIYSSGSVSLAAGATVSGADFTASGRVVRTKTQVGTQTGFGGIFVSSSIPVTSSYQTLLSSGTNDVMLTSAPQISTSTTAGGTTILTSGTFLVLTSTANGVVFCDEGTCAGSKLQLGAAQRTVNQYDILELVYDATDGFWREVSYTSN